MHRITLREVLRRHQSIIEHTGGALGIRDQGRVESVLALPFESYFGVEVYPEVTDKAAALAYLLCQGHPFVDGNKRIAHMAMEVLLIRNGLELCAPVDEGEATFLAVASGELDLEGLKDWVARQVVSTKTWR